MTNLDLTLLHNIANHGRGSEMTVALHLTIDEIKMLDELNQELFDALGDLLNRIRHDKGGKEWFKDEQNAAIDVLIKCKRHQNGN